MYLGSVLGSLLTTVFFVFLIATVGYLVGGISVKGISLGTAGVLLIAIVYGMIANSVGSFTVGAKEIVLFDASIKSMYSFVSNIGTGLFVTAVGLIAGPKFFRNFNKDTVAYLLMGVIIIALGIITTLIIKFASGISISLASGLMTGALTSTPGLSAAKEVAEDADAVTAGYGIAYLFGVLGVVLFVQLVPKILKVNIEEERKNIVAVSSSDALKLDRPLKKMDSMDFFPFIFTVAAGMILGAIKIPGINFNFGASGGTLIVGLIVGHFGHLGGIDMRVRKEALGYFRELGLMLFLVGAGVPGGVNFSKYVKISYFFFGAIITLVPMIVGYILGKYVFKLNIFNNLGSITGGMTSTPALGTLIMTAGTDDVSGSYAATYPIALIIVTLGVKFMVSLL